MRISTMTFTFTATQFPVSAERIPETAARCGVEGLNWVGTNGLSPTRARHLTLDAGLAVSCYTICPLTVWHGTDKQASFDEIRRELDTAAAIEAPIIMIVPFPPNDGDDREAGRRYWFDMLRKVSPLAEQAGIIMTIEDFEGVKSPFVTAAELLCARENVPGLQITFDVGNAAMGENPVETCSKLAGGIAYVHLQDLTICKQETPGSILGLDGRRYAKAVLGEGQLDLPGVLKELKRQNYLGFMDIEYANGELAPEDAVTRSVRYLKKQCAS